MAANWVRLTGGCTSWAWVTTACKSLRLSAPEPSSAVACRARCTAARFLGVTPVTPKACNCSALGPVPPTTAASTAATASLNCCNSATLSTSALALMSITEPNKFCFCSVFAPALPASICKSKRVALRVWLASADTKSPANNCKRMSLSPPAVTLLCAASLVAMLAAAPAVETSVTLTLTLPKVRPLSSVRNTPTDCEPLLATLRVRTAVLRLRSAVPTASSASIRSAVAVTFLLLPAALITAPLVDTRLTWLATTLPRVRSWPALRRKLLPVASKVVLPNWVSAPPAATLMVPVPAVFTLADTFAASAALRVTWPVPLWTEAFTVKSLPVPWASKSTLPVPWALRATPSVLPSTSVKLPAVVRSTIFPLALVRTSAWGPSLVKVVPVPLPTRCTLTATLLTVRSSASTR